MNGFVSLFFSKLPLSVGSGRFLLKKPNFHSINVSNARSNKPPNAATTITQIGIEPSPTWSNNSGYARVSI